MYCRWWYYSHLNSYFYVFHFEVFQRIVSLYYNVTLTISIKLLTAVPKHCYSDTATVSWKKIGWMCYRKQELFTLHEHLSSPYVFGGDHVNHLFFSFLFLYSLSSSCLVYSMLPVSLDCLRRVLCTQCCQCLWIVHSWLRLWFSVTLILVPR